MIAPAWPDPPEGFALRPNGAVALYVAAGLAHEVDARGLGEWAAWERALAVGSTVSGRGATAVLDGPSGRRWRLKGMRRAHH